MGNVIPQYNKNIFLEQPRRGKTHEMLITPCQRSAVWGRSPQRSVGMVAVILLVLSVLVTACSKPEKKVLAGTWRWVATTGGIGGWCYTPESEGFEAEFVFKGGTFTFYKDGEKVTSGTYHIDYDVDETIYTNEPFYSCFNIRFHLTEAQWKKVAEAFNGKLSLCSFKYLATLGYSEAEGQVFSLCDECCDGFCYTFVKEK